KIHERSLMGVKRTCSPHLRNDVIDPYATWRVVRVSKRYGMLWARPTSCWAKLHLLQYCSAEQAIGIGELLHHLKVVIALHDREADRLAGGLHGSVEIAALALEFRRLQCAVDEAHRSHELIEVALGAKLVFGLIRELDVIRACGHPHRLQVEHAAG